MGASFPFFSVPHPLTYVKPVLEDQQPKKIENITQSSLMYSETEQSLLSSAPRPQDSRSLGGDGTKNSTLS